MMSNRTIAKTCEIALRILKEHEVLELEKSIKMLGDEILRIYEKDPEKMRII